MPFKNVAYCNVFYFLTAFALFYLVMALMSGVSLFLFSKQKITFISVVGYFVLLFWMVVAYIQQRTLYSMCINSMGAGMMPENVKPTSIPSSADYLL